VAMAIPKTKKRARAAAAASSTTTSSTAASHPWLAAPQRKRASEAWELPGACRFSDDSELRNPEWIVREIQRHPEVWDELWRETTDPATLERLETGRKHVVGRNRVGGHWSLIGSAWVLSRNPDIQLFYDQQIGSSIWQAAGVSNVPSARTTHERLRELELFSPGFVQAKRKLWRRAMQLDARIGRHVHVDATATSAHARLHHACTDRERCKALGGRPPRVIERLEGDEADGQRHREAAKSPEEVEREQAEWQKRNAPPHASEDIEEEAVGRAAAETVAEAAAETTRHPKYDYERPTRAVSSTEPNEIFIAGHRYVCLDHDAGFRIYQIKSGKKVKAWLGGLKLTATDDYTGATIASMHIRADQAEHQHYAELLERVRDVLGCYPEVVVCDRHYNVRHVRELNEQLGIGDVIPFRKPNQSIKTRSQLAIEGVVDEYGIPQCDYCGSPGAKLRHVRKRDKGYVRFVCANPHTPECFSKVQSRPCSVQPYLLGVLSRDTELYFALRTQGKVKEMVHRHQRARYAVGGNNVDTRPKMRGFGVLELRALIAEFLEIFRVSLRQGWLKSRAKLNKITPRKRDGSRALAGFKRLRKIKKLLLPRGPAAAKLGLVFNGELPPDWPVRDRNGDKPSPKKRRWKAPPEPPPDDVPF
jgi:hypothetical protein